MKELVIATRNKGKIHELMGLLSGIDVQLIDVVERLIIGHILCPLKVMLEYS
mgnify:CR=1 FL=1